MNLVLFGPPGVGKGTQAEHLAKTHQLFPISTGNLLREEVSRGTEIGKEIADIMSAGKFPGDEIVVSLVAKIILEVSEKSEYKGVLLDGFPRTMAQGQALEQILTQQRQVLDAVIVMEINDDVLVDRLKGRFNCATCGKTYHEALNKPRTEGVCDVCQGTQFQKRADDREEAIRTRLKVYADQTSALIPFYEKQGLVRRIAANDTIENVQSAIESAIC